MDYEEFKAEFLRALRDSGIPMFSPWPDETLDLRLAARTFRVHVLPARPERGRPLTVSGTIWWTWDALLTARTASSDADVLHEIVGSNEARETTTDRPYLRVDLELNAKFDWGKAIPMPPQETWARWGREAVGRLESVERLIADETVEPLPSGRFAVLGWQGKPKLEVSCDDSGQLRLDGASVSAFQLIDLPRNSSDSETASDPHPAPRLRELFTRARAALQAWDEVMDHLVPAQP